jgi:dTDP-glucose 4,6-dehydratase
MIYGCYHKEPLPVYGTGSQSRDWIFVDDHAAAVWLILDKGISGRVYGIGGGCERTNLDLVHALVEEFASLKGEDPKDLKKLITHVSDRPGHDFRYAIDSSRIRNELGWHPLHGIGEGLGKTLAWYLKHPERLEVEV